MNGVSHKIFTALISAPSNVTKYSSNVNEQKYFDIYSRWVEMWNIQQQQHKQRCFLLIIIFHPFFLVA